MAGAAITVVSSLTLVGPSPDAATQEDAERYSLEKTADGYVRLDNRTGEMSICTERAGQLVCRMAADERTALENEIDRVSARLQDVEKRLSVLEGGTSPAPSAQLPSEEDFEKTLTFMERFFRRFMGVIRDLEQEDPAPQGSGPGRT